MAGAVMDLSCAETDTSTRMESYQLCCRVGAGSGVNWGLVCSGADTHNLRIYWSTDQTVLQIMESKTLRKTCHSTPTVEVILQKTQC